VSRLELQLDQVQLRASCHVKLARQGLAHVLHVRCFVLQYSFSLTTFSPSGKLVQIEYALNAVAAGATSLGISATDGVVIATEKKLPSILVDEATVQKICMLTPNIGVVYSGMGPDYRVLVRKARKTAQAYHRLYNEHIPVAQLVRETAAVMQEFTRKYNSVFLSKLSCSLAPNCGRHTK
jgi:20S proteasome alpha/beta subunit